MVTDTQTKQISVEFGQHRIDTVKKKKEKEKTGTKQNKTHARRVVRLVRPRNGDARGERGAAAPRDGDLVAARVELREAAVRVGALQAEDLVSSVRTHVCVSAKPPRGWVELVTSAVP